MKHIAKLMTIKIDHDRYSEVVSTTTTGFNPSVAICATIYGVIQVQQI